MRGFLIGGLAVVLLAGGCYRTGRPFAPATFDREPGWVSVVSVPAIRQQGTRDCGDAVAAMLLRYWGMSGSEAVVRAASGVPPERGLSADFLRRYLRSLGFEAYLFEGNLHDLERELVHGRPVMVGILKKFSNQVFAHYQVVVGIHRAKQEVVVIDPAEGWSVYSFDAFLRQWKPTHYLTMVVFRVVAPLEITD